MHALCNTSCLPGTDKLLCGVWCLRVWLWWCVACRAAAMYRCARSTGRSMTPLGPSSSATRSRHPQQQQQQAQGHTGHTSGEEKRLSRSRRLVWQPNVVSAAGIAGFHYSATSGHSRLGWHVLLLHIWLSRLAGLGHSMADWYTAALAWKQGGCGV